MAKKNMRLVFKSGASVTTPYSYKLYQEIVEKMGQPGESGKKDSPNMVEGKNFKANVANLEGIFFEIEEDGVPAVADKAEEAAQ